MIPPINAGTLPLQATQDPFSAFDVEFNNALKAPDLGPDAAQGPSFADVLTGALEDVQKTQNASEKLAFDYATGKPVDVHQVMIAVAKADVAMNVASSVVTKVSSGLNTLLQTQV
ncbi:MAG TPA: flagellar hook-basal body complex protein FliE [Oscillatoriaceae cyanobacterium]